MATIALQDFTGASKAIGRAAVFYGTEFTYVASPTGADLALTHAGDTEGEITIDLNETYSDRKFPELTGDAIHERKVAGMNPIVNIPMFVADPALRAILSATGSKHAGYDRPRVVTRHCLVLVPEETFIESNLPVSMIVTNTAGTVAYAIGGDAATAAQLALLDNAMFFWSGHFETVSPGYRFDGGGTVNKPVKFQSIYNPSMPIGHRLYTTGRPDQATPPILIDAV